MAAKLAHELPLVDRLIREHDHAYFDGACEPRNPGGWGGWGFAIFDPGRSKVAEGHGVMRPRETMSNNVAEYAAAGAAVKRYRELGRQGPLVLVGDSQLVVMQMRGMWQARANTLYYPVYERIRRLVADCAFDMHWHWIPRDRNTIADELSKRGLEQEGIRPATRDR